MLSVLHIEFFFMNHNVLERAAVSRGRQQRTDPYKSGCLFRNKNQRIQLPTVITGNVRSLLPMAIPDFENR